ncbi:MAG: pilus assembly PilX N-terminal domain-containing protein [bacterium]
MKKDRKKRGVALVLAIAAVFILLFVGIILVVLARRQLQLATSLKFRTEAFANAETGIEKVMARFRTYRVHNEALVQAIDEKGCKVGVRWFDRHPLPGYQISPKHLAGSSFEGFYYHGTSTGTKGGAERKIHFTVVRVYPREW